MDDVKEQGQDDFRCSEVSEDDEMNLVDYIRVILKYRRMIVLICGISVVATGIISLLSPKRYSAATTIVPPIKQAGLAGELGSGKNSLLAKVMETTSIADMYVSILESRAVANAIIDRFDLMRVYGVKKRVSAHKKLRGDTVVKVSKELIIRIKVEDRDPNRVAAIANAYVEELDRQNKRLSTGQATSKRIFLENRLAEIEEKLSKIDNILSREAKVQEMLFELLTREYELAKIEEARNMPTIQVLDRAVVPETRMSRGTKRKVLLAGVVSFMFAALLAFFLESSWKDDVRRILTQA